MNKMCLLTVAVMAVAMIGSGCVSFAQTRTNGARPSELSENEKQAQFHYKVALTALKNNDLDVANREMEQAAKLAPKNALIQYNLAIVKSKAGHPAEALTALRQAISLGLPSAQSKAADDLLVQMTYETEHSTAGRLSWLTGIGGRLQICS